MEAQKKIVHIWRYYLVYLLVLRQFRYDFVHTDIDCVDYLLILLVPVPCVGDWEDSDEEELQNNICFSIIDDLWDLEWKKLIYFLCGHEYVIDRNSSSFNNDGFDGFLTKHNFSQNFHLYATPQTKYSEMNWL